MLSKPNSNVVYWGVPQQKHIMNKKHKISKIDILILAQVVLILCMTGLILYLQKRGNTTIQPSTNTTNNFEATTNTNQNSTSGAGSVNSDNTTNNTTTNTPTPSVPAAIKTPAIISEALKGTESLTFQDWDWEEGVALQGMGNYYVVTQDTSVLDATMKKFALVYSKAPKKTSDVLLANQGILGETALTAYKQTSDKKYLNSAQILANALMSWTAVAPNGAYLHFYPKYCQSCDNKNYVWADTLFMTTPFLAKMTEVTGDTKYVQKAASQILLHAEYLQDANGLIHHASKADGATNTFQFWGRANGWFLASAVSVAEVLPKNDPSRKKIETIVQKQAAALKTLQDAGLWHTVIDHKETYKESSGSALIAYGLLKALRLGILDSSYQTTASSAVDALQKQVGSTGMLQNVSAATGPSTSAAYYQSVAATQPQLYGQGAFFNMMAEKAK